jgi:hypothetical protein
MEHNVDHGVVQTPAEFRQLHVKLPPITFRDPPPPPPLEEDGTTAPPNPSPSRSNAWLDAHGKGFLLMHNLHTVQPPGRCILVKSLDTGELVVNKRLKRYAPVWNHKHDPHYYYTKPPEKWEYAWHERLVPGELRFSRLDDSQGRVAVRLPNEPYFPELYAYGFPYGYKEGRETTPDVWSLYFKRYNGGSLSNLMEMYADPQIGGPVPEPFVWHVMEQLARAVVYLHTGLTRRELASKGKKKEKDCWWMAKVAEGKWTPLVHRDIREENILLHFPEKGGNARNRCFPRIVLEGFSRANLVDDEPSWWHFPPAYEGGGKADGEKIRPEPWEDMYLMGDVLRRLVAVYETGKRRTGDRVNFNANRACRMSWHLSENLDLHEAEKPAYSDELINLLRRWEISELLDDPARQRHFSDDGIWQQIPGIEFLIKEVLPTATKKMKKYRTMSIARLTGEDEDGLMGDVSWVKPDQTFEAMPYSANKGTQEHSLAVLKRELKYLYGPWIPIWYRYERLVVTKVPPQAERFYAPGEHITSPRRDQGEQMRLRGGGDSDSDSLFGDQWDPDGDAPDPVTQYTTLGDDAPVDSSTGVGDEEEKGDDGQNGDEEDPRREDIDREEGDYESEEAEEQETQTGVTEREPDPEYIARIRRFQSEEKAKQQPIQVWHRSREVKETKARGRITKIANEAAEVYSRLVGDMKQRMSDVFEDVEFDDCGCSNCVRELDKFIVSEVK